VNIPGDWNSTLFNGTLISVPKEDEILFSNFCDEKVKTVRSVTDGETVDALEHYFWGQTHGIALVIFNLLINMSLNIMNIF
jgi:hypothetical protein